MNYYNGYSFTWQNGRQLAAASNGANVITYQYNDSGIRTSKTVDGVTTTYYIEGGNIAWQTDGTNTIHYTYDANGNLVYMNLNGQIYYYERNGQGDIIGLVDSGMNEVVTYSYDTWGKLLGITDTSTNNVGTLNPFRYRGYYYDTETGLYYLNSRYYDPNTGRYLNADGQFNDSLLGTNMFAYCENNPVNLSDPNGDWAFLAVLLPLAFSNPITALITVVAIVVVVIVVAALIDHAIYDYNTSHIQYAHDTGGYTTPVTPSSGTTLPATTPSSKSPIVSTSQGSSSKQATLDKHPWNTLPTSGSIPFIPPVNKAGNPVFNKGPNHGLLDNLGREWNRDKGAEKVGNPHWDVQDSAGTHTNVNGNDVANPGEINHGK